MLRPLLLGLVFLLLGGCDKTPADVVALGTLERDRIELAADSNEPIEEIYVTEGQNLGVGDVILRQNAARAQAALARARAEEQIARAALAEAEEGPRAQAIDQARARLQAARSAQATAQHELQRQKSLVERNFSTQSNVDILQGRFDESVARTEEAEAVLAELLAGTRSEKIDQARSRYAAATATVNDLSITLERATVVSPVEGTVEVLPFELGERPRPGTTVAIILARAPIYARVHIPEPIRAQIAPGTAAEVYIDGFAQPFAAQVRWVAADASFTPYFALSERDRTRLSFLAEVDLLGESAPELAIGVPVQVTFPELEL